MRRKGSRARSRHSLVHCTGTLNPATFLPRFVAHSQLEMSVKKNDIGNFVGHKRAKEFAFLPGNAIDGPTAVKWGWANHCVSASGLVDAVRSLANRIAKVPPDVLRLKKLSINRAAEAGGFRQALSGIAEIDALLHLAPAVLEIRARMKTAGIKAVIEEFKVAPSNLFAAPEEQ